MVTKFAGRMRAYLVLHVIYNHVPLARSVAILAVPIQVAVVTCAIDPHKHCTTEHVICTVCLLCHESSGHDVLLSHSRQARTIIRLRNPLILKYKYATS